MNEQLQEAAFAEYTAALEMYRVRLRLDLARAVVSDLEEVHEKAQRRYENARVAVLDLAKSDADSVPDLSPPSFQADYDLIGDAERAQGPNA